MIHEADAVVIGAGAFGSSIAYHLARRGRRVALVEKHDLVSQTSARAAGLTQQIRADPLLFRLAMRSVQQIERFTEETGETLVFHQPGSIKLARSHEFARQIDQDIECGQALGLDIERISRADARTLAPFLNPEGAVAISYTKSDLFLEAADLPLSYARAAMHLGAAVLPHTAVTGIGSRHGTIERVVTERGEIRTPVVVDAAGAWTRVVAEMTGIHVPVVPIRHQLYITKPIEGITDEQPIVRIVDAHVYVRPARGGLMFGGYEPDPLAIDVHALPSSFQIAELALDIAPLRRLTENVRAQFPALGQAEVVELRGGLPTMTADGRQIVDQVPGIRGFFVASGCCVGGLSLSPAIGEVLADWVVEGHPSMDLSSLSLSRFGPDMQSEDRLREACLWQYAHHYADAGR